MADVISIIASVGVALINLIAVWRATGNRETPQTRLIKDQFDLIKSTNERLSNESKEMRTELGSQLSELQLAVTRIEARGQTRRGDLR